LEYSEGFPPGVSGWEVTGADEWYLKIIPGDCSVRAIVSPYDEKEERIFASDVMGSDPSDRKPDSWDMLDSWWISRNISYNGTYNYIANGIGTLGRGEVGYFVYTEQDYFGWEVEAKFPTTGDNLEISFLKQWDPTEYSAPANGGSLDPAAERWVGVRVTRESDTELVYYAVINDDGTEQATEISRKTVPSWSENIWVGAARYPSEVLQCRIRYGDKWEGPYAFGAPTYTLHPTSYIPASLALLGWRSPVLTLQNTVRAFAMNLFYSGVAVFDYTVPDQYYGPTVASVGTVDGAWADDTQRFRVRIESPTILSEKVVATRYPVSTLASLSVNSVPLTLSEVTVSERQLTLPTSVTDQDSVSVTYTHRDFGMPYRGYLSGSTWYDGDLNPRHPWSPLYNNETVYIYLRPVGSNLLYSDLSGGKAYYHGTTRRVSALYHTTEPIQSTSHQLLAIISKREGLLPIIKDLRTVPSDLEVLGAWNRQESFSGPSYSEGGAVVVEVPSGKQKEAGEAAPHAVAAGMRILIREEGDDPITRLGSPPSE